MTSYYDKDDGFVVYNELLDKLEDDYVREHFVDMEVNVIIEKIEVSKPRRYKKMVTKKRTIDLDDGW